MLTLLIIAGCSGKSDDSSGGTGPDDSATGSGLRFGGTVVDWASREPLEDVDVCLYPENRCVLSSPDGGWTIFSDRTDDEEFLVTALEPGFITLAQPYTLDGKGDPPEATLALWGDDLVGQLEDQLSIDIDPTKAMLEITAEDSSGAGVSGLSFSLDPKDGLGPFYATAGGVFSDSSPTSGEGQAVFFDLADNASMKIFVDGAKCENHLSWRGLVDGSFRANLEAERLFTTRIRCP